MTKSLFAAQRVGLIGLVISVPTDTNDSAYGACCHHGEAIARVHSVHLMNADWAPDGRQPSNQANRLGL